MEQVAIQVRLFRFLGFTQDVNVCEYCGKVDLKGTYILQNNESGEIIHMGSTCGSKALGWTTKDFITVYKAEEREQYQSALTDYRNHESTLFKEAWLNDLNNRHIYGPERWSTFNDPEYLAATERQKAFRETLNEKYPLIKKRYIS